MVSEGIRRIIEEPIHGAKFYTKETLEDLIVKLAQLHNQLDISEKTEQEITISIIQNYVKSNVKLRDSYFDAFCERVENFDKQELIYRTAYGALVKGQAMCAGYVEAVRLLLEMYGIKAHTLLSKLPGNNKRLLHYVVVAEYNKNGKKKYIVLDPERQANCEKKGMDYERYRSNMIYALPNPIFTDDVVGNTGLGMTAEEYLSHADIQRVTGTTEISKLVDIIEKKEEANNKVIGDIGNGRDD